MKNNYLSFSEAINQGIEQSMKISKDVILMGQLVNSEHGVFGTTSGLSKKFGENRVRDFPVCESLMTSAAIGAAIGGLKVILVHIRIDFLYYSMDAIVNWLSLWRFKSGGKQSCQVLIRAIVGKGWGNGPQHSKSTHSWFANLPGLRVGIPTNAFDAKGMIIDSVFNNDPTILIEHRSLFDLKDKVPSNPYRIEFGKCAIRQKGKDVTIVAIGYGLVETMNSLSMFYSDKIYPEVIDVRSLWPLDIDTILNSVKKTKRLAVVDPGWKSFGASSEIISLVMEKIGKNLKCHPIKITYPDSHTPTSEYLEKLFYFDEKIIYKKIKKIITA